jgi:hypothetical protein
MGITRLVCYAAAIAGASLALPSHAQTSNTRCTTTFGVTNCTTQQQPGINWGIINQQRQEQLLNPLNAYQQGLEARRQREAAEAQRESLRIAQQEAAQQQETEDQQRELGRQAGKLVAEGKCDEARTLALDAGNFDLAHKVNEYCEGR